MRVEQVQCPSCYHFFKTQLKREMTLEDKVKVACPDCGEKAQLYPKPGSTGYYLSPLPESRKTSEQKSEFSKTDKEEVSESGAVENAKNITSSIFTKAVWLIKTIGKIILTIFLLILFLLAVNGDGDSYPSITGMIMDEINNAKGYEHLINDNRPITGKLDRDYYTSGDTYTFTYEVVINSQKYRGETETDIYPEDFDNVTLYYLPSDPSIISINPPYDHEQNPVILTIIFFGIFAPLSILFMFLGAFFGIWGKL